MKTTKYLFSILIILFVFACKPSADEAIIPDDLAGKKEILSAKKKALKSLQKEIDLLKKDIDILEPPKEKAAAQVVTQRLQSREFKRYIEVQARVVADEVANASSETGGRILSMKVREGAYVKKGQLIASIDMSTTEGQIDEIQTALDLATTVFEKRKRLWDQNIGSEIQFLEAKNNKERLEKSLTTINSQLNKKNVYAPVSGIVDKKYLSQGEMASPGMPIVQILNTSKIKVVADLQESLLGRIKVGDQLEVYYPSLEKTVKKAVSMIGRSIDPANRTFQVEVATNSMNGQLKPNLMAQIRLNDLTESGAIIIPIDAVQEDIGGNKFVYKVADKDGKKIASKTLIELGESSEEGVMVIIGLKEGDELITDGSMRLSANDPIQIAPKQ